MPSVSSALTRTATSVARLVSAGRTESPGGRVQFSEAARTAALDHVEGRCREGASLTAAARETGVPYQTLRRWRARRQWHVPARERRGDERGIDRVRGHAARRVAHRGPRPRRRGRARAAPAVITLPRRVRVYALAEPADLRKGFEGLSALVRQRLGRDPLSGHLFLFMNRMRHRAKVLLWDGTGLCVYAKRIERGRFAGLWRDAGADPITLTVSELDLFLDGSTLVGRVALTPPALTQFSLASDHGG